MNPARIKKPVDHIEQTFLIFKTRVTEIQVKFSHNYGTFLNCRGSFPYSETTWNMAAASQQKTCASTSHLTY